MNEASLQMANRLNNLYEKCDELSTAGGCANGVLRNADVNAETIFGMDTQDTTLQTTVNATWAGSNAQLSQAALDYCRSVIASATPDPNQNALVGSPQGLATYQLRKAANARESLAQKACYDLAIERQPVAANLAADSLAWGIKTLKDLNYNNNNLPQTLSPYQLKKILYSMQFADPNWTQLVSSDSEAQQLRIAVELNTLRLRLQWETYEVMDEIKLMKAARNAIKVEASRVNAPSSALPSQ